jgi:hypothetical protein
MMDIKKERTSSIELDIIAESTCSSDLSDGLVITSLRE